MTEKTATPPAVADEGSPVAYIFAGPNGAGKTSAASALLPASIPPERFVNSDLIARHIRTGEPGPALLEAGRLALRAVEEHVARRESFALETTLSGVWTTSLLTRLVQRRYELVLLYFWLPSADVALARVRARVARGGHDVPELDVRRRYERSLANFAVLRQREAIQWAVIDGRDPMGGIVAQTVARDIQVMNPVAWAEIAHSIGQVPPPRRGR